MKRSIFIGVCIGLLVFLSGCSLLFYSAAQLEKQPELATELLENAPQVFSDEQEFLQAVRQSEQLATDWLLTNFREKGIFVYQYDPVADEYPPQNNMIRQLMASRLLAEMSQTDSNLQELHRRNLDFIFRYWYRETNDGQFGYIFYNAKSKLGANAMALRTLVFSPFFEEYETEARQLADGILSLMNSDGALNPWFLEPDYEYDADYLLTFYSGEAILALVEYGLLPGNEDYFEAAQKAQEFYLERYVEELEKNYYPAYVPWHTLALNKFYKATGEQKYADAIFILNDKLLELLDTSDHIGRFYNPATPQYGSPHIASDGVYTEGLAYALEIAKMVNDEMNVEKYDEALKLAVAHLISMQYAPGNIRADFDQERVQGGFPARPGAYMIRIDNVQHTLDAYRKIREIFEK